VRLNVVFRALGISKQSFHQKLNRQMLLLEEKEQLLVLIRQIREDHPRMSSRQMYRLLKPAHFGRDRFEALCFDYGFKVSVKRSYHRTTNSLGVTRFNNLLMDSELTGINQVWVSDITYYRIEEKFYYLTFFMDRCSRFIVGHSVSSDLSTNSTTIPALKIALKTRKIGPGIIIHSDGGGQYYCKEWLMLTSNNKMRNSMCESPYENPHAERINGIIKNDYLAGYGPTSFDQLIAMTKKAVDKYNREKPHGSLGNVSPDQYERSAPKELSTVQPKEKKNQKKKKRRNMDNSRRVTHIPANDCNNNSKLMYI
jgi:putative transposase